MKKSIYFILFFLILFSLTLSASLLDVYKSGKIKLVPDPDFGKGTEWDIYFPQGIKDIAFAKDGSFFATGLGNKAQHCVYKFDKDGKFLKKIGRKGRGPGDLYHPGALSILDNKYLLVNNYDKRISVFDLEGNFVKIIRTKDDVFDVVGLKNNKIVILRVKSQETKKKITTFYNIMIEDIRTGKKYNVFTIKKTEKNKGAVGRLSSSFFKESFFLKKLNNEKILFSCNWGREIRIYDYKIKKIRVFKNEYKRGEINDKIRKYFYKMYKEEFSRKGRIDILEALRKQYKTRTLLPEYKPYYRLLMVNEKGNIIILRSNIFYFSNGALVIKEEVRMDIFNEKGDKITSIRFKKGEISENLMRGFLRGNDLWFDRGSMFYYDEKDEKLAKIKIKSAREKIK